MVLCEISGEEIIKLHTHIKALAQKHISRISSDHAKAILSANIWTSCAAKR